MDQETVFLTILGMALVTYVPRLLPIWLLSSRRLPRLAVAWLRYVPVAALAAMLAPELFVDDGGINLGPNNLFLWAALPAFIVAWRRRSLFSTVAVGMAVVAAARLVLG